MPDLYGKGPAFPFKRSKGGNFMMAQGYDLLDMGVKQTVLTAIYSRPMRKEIGNKIDSVLFSLEGDLRDNVVFQYIEEAFESMEPRAILLEATVSEKDNEIYVFVKYQPITSNVERNLVVQINGG